MREALMATEVVVALVVWWAAWLVRADRRARIGIGAVLLWLAWQTS
jgi:hypothetical protein